MKNIKLKMFELPLHLCCSSDMMRPAMQHIYFKDGYMYATDAQILVKGKQSIFIKTDEQSLKFLDDKFIHKKIYEEIYKIGNFIIQEDGISIIKNDTKIKYYYSKNDYFKYPNCNLVLDQQFKKEENRIDKISISPDNFKKLCNAMQIKYSPVLELYSRNKSIKVLNSEYKETELLGLLMPIMLP